MEITLSTHNPSKAIEIKAIFEGSDIIVHTLEDVGIEGEAEETALTLEGNAALKSFFAYEKSGGKSWSMADDTGIFITALDGEPGVRSAKWLSDTATTEETQNYCLKRLVGKKDRSAVFKTVVVVTSPEGVNFSFSGEVQGTMLEMPRVPFRPKMPYSALFVPEGETRSFAEMTIERENKISHRGKAFRLAHLFLENQ